MLCPVLRIEDLIHFVQVVFINQRCPIGPGVQERGIPAQDIIPAARGIDRCIGHNDVFHVVLHRVFDSLFEGLRHKRDRVFRVLQVFVQHTRGGVVKQEDRVAVVQGDLLG